MKNIVKIFNLYQTTQYLNKSPPVQNSLPHTVHLPAAWIISEQTYITFKKYPHTYLQNFLVCWDILESDKTIEYD